MTRAAGDGAGDEHGPWPEDGPGPPHGSCGAHAGLGADLRGTALHLLERVREVVEPLGEDSGPGAGRGSTPAPSPGSAGACQACPVCAVIAVLRGERSELATRLAEHATGLVAVLKAVLEADAARDAERAGSGRSGSGGSGPGSADDRRPETPRAGERNPETGRHENVHAHPGRGEHAPSAPASARRPGSRPSGRPVQRIVVHRR